uniref:Uncharacterized protein n=1 Tax=Moniliophthora roreri TaxID=221103 RepID=A0A0W0FLP8_MONRR
MLTFTPSDAKERQGFQDSALELTHIFHFIGLPR